MSSAYLQLLKERGVGWVFNRSLYNVKLKTLRLIPATEKIYEKKIPEVKRLDIFSVNVSALKQFLSQLPQDEKDTIINDANEACNGNIKCFSSVKASYKNPVNWQLNPLTGMSCDKNQKWFCIPDFDAQRGDIKIIWEISRFTHFFLLARAYLLTDDTKYLEAFKEQLNDWIENNPYSFGANYKCGQECSLRMISCLLVFPVFKDGLTPEDNDNIKKLVDRCYKKILSNFFYAYKCQKNNHAVSEAVGMIVGAWCCGDNSKLKKTYKILDGIIDNQFTDDGGYVQQSFNYQRLALQDIEAVMSFSEKTGMSLSDNSLDKIKKSVLQMYQCQDDSGDMPNYGANDGALIFPVTSCKYRDFRPVINTSFALITEKRLFENGIYDEELFWFGLSDDLPIQKTERKSSSFADSGLYTLRNGKIWAMVVSQKKINHMDENHVDVWADGINVFCDSGTYSYAEEAGRALFATKAHNTAFCGNKEQINRLGNFAVYGQPQRLEISADESSVKSSVKFKSGYVHSRTVTLNADGVTLIDKVDGPEECGIVFNTPCKAEINGNKATLFNNGERVCSVNSSVPLKSEPSQISLYYMRMENSTRIYANTEKNEIRTNILIGDCNYG